MDNSKVLQEGAGKERVRQRREEEEGGGRKEAAEIPAGPEEAEGQKDSKSNEAEGGETEIPPQEEVRTTLGPAQSSSHRLEGG